VNIASGKRGNQFALQQVFADPSLAAWPETHPPLQFFIRLSPGLLWLRYNTVCPVNVVKTETSKNNSKIKKKIYLSALFLFSELALPISRNRQCIIMF
jgi:hypothetical protein